VDNTVSTAWACGIVVIMHNLYNTPSPDEESGTLSPTVYDAPYQVQQSVVAWAPLLALGAVLIVVLGLTYFGGTSTVPQQVQQDVEYTLPFGDMRPANKVYTMPGSSTWEYWDAMIDRTGAYVHVMAADSASSTQHVRIDTVALEDPLRLVASAEHELDVPGGYVRTAVAYDGRLYVVYTKQGEFHVAYTELNKSGTYSPWQTMVLLVPGYSVDVVSSVRQVFDKLHLVATVREQGSDVPRVAILSLQLHDDMPPSLFTPFVLPLDANTIVEAMYDAGRVYVVADSDMGQGVYEYDMQTGDMVRFDRAPALKGLFAQERSVGYVQNTELAVYSITNTGERSTAFMAQHSDLVPGYWGAYTFLDGLPSNGWYWLRAHDRFSVFMRSVFALSGDRVHEYEIPLEWNKRVPIKSREYKLTQPAEKISAYGGMFVGVSPTHGVEIVSAESGYPLYGGGSLTGDISYRAMHGNQYYVVDDTCSRLVVHGPLPDDPGALMPRATIDLDGPHTLASCELTVLAGGQYLLTHMDAEQEVVTVYDLSDPYDPKRIARTIVNGDDGFVAFEASATHLYALRLASNNRLVLEVRDLHSSDLPVLYEETQLPIDADNDDFEPALGVHEDVLFSRLGTQVALYEITDPANPVFRYHGKISAVASQFVGGKLYALERGKRTALVVYDLTNPKDVREVAVVPRESSCDQQNLWYLGDYLLATNGHYCSNARELTMFNIADADGSYEALRMYLPVTTAANALEYGIALINNHLWIPDKEYWMDFYVVPYKTEPHDVVLASTSTGNSVVDTVTVDAETLEPSGTDVSFYASVNGGAVWSQIEAAVPYTFPVDGSHLVVKAVLQTSDPEKTPTVRSVSVQYTVRERGTRAVEQVVDAQVPRLRHDTIDHASTTAEWRLHGTRLPLQYDTKPFAINDFTIDGFTDYEYVLGAVYALPRTEGVNATPCKRVHRFDLGYHGQIEQQTSFKVPVAGGTNCSLARDGSRRFLLVHDDNTFTHHVYAPGAPGSEPQRVASAPYSPSDEYDATLHAVYESEDGETVMVVYIRTFGKDIDVLQYSTADATLQSSQHITLPEGSLNGFVGYNGDALLVYSSIGNWQYPDWGIEPVVYQLHHYIPDEYGQFQWQSTVDIDDREFWLDGLYRDQPQYVTNAFVGYEYDTAVYQELVYGNEAVVQLLPIRVAEGSTRVQVQASFDQPAYTQVAFELSTDGVQWSSTEPGVWNEIPDTTEKVHVRALLSTEVESVSPTLYGLTLGFELHH